jgi:hypothetical protein
MSNNSNSNEINLDNYLLAIWRAKWFIILITLLAAATAYYLVRKQPTLYKAEALLEIGRVWEKPLEDTYTTEEIVNSTGFAHELASKLGVKVKAINRGILAAAIVVGPRNTRYPILLKITTTTESEAEAVNLAQAVSDDIIARHEKLFDEAIAPRRVKQQRLEERLQELNAQAASKELAFKIEDELDATKFNNLSPTITRKTALVQPIVPVASVQPSALRNVAAAALIAAAGSAFLAALGAYFKSSPPTEVK